jgi:hypothetical protein
MKPSGKNCVLCTANCRFYRPMRCKLAAVEAEHRQVAERIQTLSDELFSLRGRETALRMKISWDRQSIHEGKREREKQLPERGERSRATNPRDRHFRQLNSMSFQGATPHRSVQAHLRIRLLP